MYKLLDSLQNRQIEVNTLRGSIIAVDYHLDKERREHVLGVYRKMLQLTEKYSHYLTQEDIQMLLISSVLHDIGYTKACGITQYHPIDGFIYLKENGWDIKIRKLVMHHSLSRELCLFMYPDLFSFYQENSLTAREEVLMNYLTLADFTTSPTGETVTIKERVKDIEQRHTNTHIVRHAHVVGSYLERVQLYSSTLLNATKHDKREDT